MGFIGAFVATTILGTIGLMLAHFFTIVIKRIRAALTAVRAGQ